MSNRIRRFSAVITWVLLSNPVRAEWVAQTRISEKIFADVTSATTYEGGPRRFYGLTKEGMLTPTVVDSPAGGVITGYLISNQRNSDLYEMWLDSGSWQVKNVDFRVPRDGGRLIEMGCRNRRLLLHYHDGTILRFGLGGAAYAKSWIEVRTDPQPAATESWPKGIFWAQDLNKAFDGRTEFGSYAISCNPFVPNRISSVAFSNDLRVVLMAYDDIRGDGRKRFYGFDGGGAVLEVEESSPAWKVTQTINPATGGEYEVQMVAGDGRGDGRRRLYVAHHRGLIEYEWNGSRFYKRLVKPPNVSGWFSGATSGLLIGSFRPDGRPRIYVSNEHSLIEFMFMDGRWIGTVYSLGIGRLGGLASGYIDGHRNHLFALSDRSGLYELEWREPPVIAVLPFYARGVPESDGRTYAEVLRTKVLSSGGCRVVERERINAVLKEQRLHAGKLVDTQSAIRVARVLKADYIVTGSVGKLLQEQLASVSVISVADGVVKSADFVQWRKDAEMDNVLGDIAVKACPK